MEMDIDKAMAEKNRARATEKTMEESWHSIRRIW